MLSVVGDADAAEEARFLIGCIIDYERECV